MEGLWISDSWICNNLAIVSIFQGPPVKLHVDVFQAHSNTYDLTGAPKKQLLLLSDISLLAKESLRNNPTPPFE